MGNNPENGDMLVCYHTQSVSCLTGTLKEGGYQDGPLSFKEVDIVPAGGTYFKYRQWTHTLAFRTALALTIDLLPVGPITTLPI